MMVDDLDIGDEYKEIIKSWGITELYPPQEKAVKEIMKGKNVFVSIPTASGKTLIAYISIFRALTYGGKAVYLSPLKALSSEKYHELADPLEDLEKRVALGVGDYTKDEVALKTADVRIMTFEKLDSMLHRSSDIAYDTDVLVLDEIHMLGDETRGSTLEYVITKMRYYNPNLQIVSLSATVHNAKEIAEWLDSELIESNWRPIPLNKMIYRVALGELDIYSPVKKRYMDIIPDKLIIGNLIKHILDTGGQALIFVGRRRWAESLADKLRKITRTYMTFQDRADLSSYRTELKEELDEITSLTKKVMQFTEDAVSFHHAGLNYLTRKYVEDMFRKGLVKVIVATPTLAAGVNLPSRWVIVRDTTRTVMGADGRLHSVYLRKIEVEQMLGRAGRPKYDKEGYAVIVAKDEEAYHEIVRRYALGELEDIVSHADYPPSVRREVLAIANLGIISTPYDLSNYFARTFKYYQLRTFAERDAFIDEVRKQYEWLVRKDFIDEVNEIIHKTELGKITNVMYIDPASVDFVIAPSLRDTLDDFAILHAIACAPDMPKVIVKKGEPSQLLEVLGRNVTAVTPQEVETFYGRDIYLSTVKMAEILREWIDEVSIEQIAKEYDVGEGDIVNYVSTAEWLAYAGYNIVNALDMNGSDKYYEMYIRISYGVKKELVELAQLKYIGRKRARALYDAGFTNLEMIAYADTDELCEVSGIGRRIAESIKSQAHNLIVLRGG